MPTSPSTDCLIIGGGIVGLSIAYELAKSGRTVRLLERGETGREASWAGAGILPPGSWFSDHPALGELAALSHPLHTALSGQLCEETGIDDELLNSGALYAITNENQPSLTSKFASWNDQGIASERLSPGQTCLIDPQYQIGRSFLVPGERQVRNPRRLSALRSACEQAGVAIQCQQEVTSLEQASGRVAVVVTKTDRFAADQVCLTAGAWTAGIGAQLGQITPTKPIRGQILLLKLSEQKLKLILHCDGHYLVPRKDGHVLVGSTVEEAGFDKSTNEADIATLLAFAHKVAPCLEEAEVVTSWAGLRPGCADELPMIGRLPSLTNAWIASGHYRAGLQYSPGTALLVRQMMDGEPTAMDVNVFSPERFASL